MNVNQAINPQTMTWTWMPVYYRVNSAWCARCGRSYETQAGDAWTWLVSHREPLGRCK